MKIILMFLTIVIAYIGITASAIWAIVEFILYLVKNDPFNWWSIGTLVSCLIAYPILAILTSFILSNEKDKLKAKLAAQGRNADGSRKLSSQIRLEEMFAARNQQIRNKK